jgi:hypothetical protein
MRVWDTRLGGFVSEIAAVPKQQRSGENKLEANAWEDTTMMIGNEEEER